MTLDMTSFDAALKEHYTADRVENLVYKDNPLWALMPKYEDFRGKNLPVPLVHGNPQGRSKTFSNAQTRSTSSNSQIKDFVMTRVKDYAIATIDNETLEASKGNSNAFMEAATTEIDGAINSLTRSLAVNQYRDSSGYIGQVSVEPTEAVTTTLTMKSLGDISNVEIDQIIEIYSAKSGGSVRTVDGTLAEGVVTEVDRDAGTFVLGITATGGDMDYTSSGDIAADDFVFIQGDRGLGLAGLEDWLPTTAPTSGDSHFGVDRSADTQRLAGVRYDGSGDPIEEALIEGASRIARHGGKPDHAFVSYTKYSELEKSLGSKVQYVDLKVNAEVGFRGILVNGPRGPIKVIPDQNCPDDKCFMLTLSTWKCGSIGKAVRIVDSDGLKLLRQTSADGVEFRAAFYGNIWCKAPGYNGVITL